MLAQSTRKRLRYAYAEKTWNSYKRMFLTLLTFCAYIEIDVTELQVHHVTMFMEYLNQNGQSVGSIRNFIAGIVSYSKWVFLCTEIFSHHRVSLMFKALTKSIPKKPRLPVVFQTNHIFGILRECEKFPYAQIYRTLYIFANLGFLRISNCVPTSKNNFSVIKHLCRGDVLLRPDSVLLVLKWSKTLQSLQQGTYLVLPKLKNALICPWHNFMELCRLFPVAKNCSCFASQFFMVTESNLRKHLAKVLRNLGLDAKQYSFHTFRRSGATLAYNLDIPMDEIKRHGTWRSDAVQSYIISDPHRASGVAQSLRKFFDHM